MKEADLYRLGLGVVLVAVVLIGSGCSSSGGSLGLPIPGFSQSDEGGSAPAAAPAELTSADEFSQQLSGSMVMPSVAYFYKPGSPSAMAMDPIMNRMATMFGGKVEVLKVDADGQAEIAQTHNIDKTPAFVGYVGGKEMKRLVGIQPPAAIQGLMQSLTQKP